MGPLAKSGSKVLLLWARFGQFGRGEAKKRRTGNDFVKDRVARYWAAAKEALATSAGPVLSLASDAT
eukprot:7156004-Lingulodinium_polyedra.AAC.1